MFREVVASYLIFRLTSRYQINIPSANINQPFIVRPDEKEIVEKRLFKYKQSNFRMTQLNVLNRAKMLQITERYMREVLDS